MTRKRFRLEVEDDMYYTIFDNQSTDEEDKLYGLDDEQICDLLNKLYEEKELWKRECKRLKGLYYLENENVELEDIIGLVKTDEPTNSVELKKELYK